MHNKEPGNVSDDSAYQQLTPEQVAFAAVIGKMVAGVWSSEQDKQGRRPRASKHPSNQEGADD